MRPSRTAGMVGKSRQNATAAPPSAASSLPMLASMMTAGAWATMNSRLTFGQAWPNVSLEFIVAQAPAVIIEASMGSEEAADGGAAVAFWRDFPTIPAVRDGRIHGYRAYALLRPGPRVAATLAAVARFLHPDLW